MTGCVKTETVIVEKTVAAIPPDYLWDAEPVPEVPTGVPPEERTNYLLEAYASRGDTIKRDQKQEALMRRWVDEIKRLYPGSAEKPLPEAGSPPSKPEAPSAE